MGTLNRTKDLSEQKEGIKMGAVTVANATTFGYVPIERSMTIVDCKTMAQGISGSPVVFLSVFRFTGVSGSASFTIGSSFVLGAYSSSGFLTYSLPAAGSTTLSLQKGDILFCTQNGGTGAATTATTIEVITQNLTDVKTWY